MSTRPPTGASLGWFSAVDADSGVALLEAAVAVAFDAGATAVVGPKNVSTWRRYRCTNFEKAPWWCATTSGEQAHPVLRAASVGLRGGLKCVSGSCPARLDATCASRTRNELRSSPSGVAWRGVA